MANERRWQAKDVDKLAAAARGATLSKLISGFAGLDANVAYPWPDPSWPR